MLSLTLGLRLGEVCGLQWKDIDLQKRVLYVRKTVQRVQVNCETYRTRLLVMPPKSESSVREIPLPKQLVYLLRGFRKQSDVFVLSANYQPLEPRTLQYRFAKILVNADLPSVSFHSLRHAFATNAIELGFDVKTLSEILGHSKVEITLDRYVHSSMDRKRACIELVV
jgi:integrase